MGRRLWLLSVICTLVAANAALAEPKPLRVLFVGNSLTYFNALPSMVTGLAARSHPVVRLEVEMLASPGATIRQTLDSGSFGKAVAGKKFDVVVLQEAGGFPLCSDDFPGCRESPAALHEAAALIHRSGARLILLATFTPPGMQAPLSLASQKLAEHLKADLFDWGKAMANGAARAQGMMLIGPDFHPTPEGSWLAAIGLSRLITGATAPDAHVRVCAPDWSHAQPPISNSSYASRQSQPPANCFEPDESTYSTLKTTVEQMFKAKS